MVIFLPPLCFQLGGDILVVISMKYKNGQNAPNGQQWTKIEQIGSNGPNWIEVDQNRLSG